jgi:hypothetical protein
VVLRVVRSGVGLGLLGSVALTLWVLTGLGGWHYYTTPLSVRGYEAAHRLLRPSGPIGQTFGVIGAAMMLVPFLYMLRKKFARWTWAGSLKAWLEVHLFCGILGPIFITYHTSFKFNGLISAAYWAMVVVVLSGFIGRYLYVRIPRTIRGTELTRTELDARATELSEAVVRSRASASWQDRASALALAPSRLSVVGLLFGEMGLKRKLRQLDRDLEAAGVGEADRRAFIQLTTDRALLARRVAYLQRTKAAFSLWHVFHLPLVYFLLVIASLHVGITLYLGYVPFRW